MSSLMYGVYPGFGEWASDNMGYSQAVRIGERIEISGQGGWDPLAPQPTFSENIREEVTQAFKNVETALKTVGGKGWSQVYRINSYHTEINHETTAAMVDNIRKYFPEHKPIWTQTGSHQLGAPGMRVEIEVVAYDPEGATKRS